MKRGLVFGVILLVLLIGITIAENETNNSNQNDTNEKNSTTEQCSSNSDCLNGYECKYNLCVIEKNNDTNENESNDKNQTNETGEKNETGGDHKNDNRNKTKENDSKDNKNKVCCMITNLKDENNTEIEYRITESKECLKNGTDKKREIVNNSLCIGEKHEFKEKQRIKFEEKTGVSCTEGCKCEGRVMKCPLESGGKEIIIFAGNSGKMIIQVKGINMTTNITIYDENGTLVGNFSKIGVKEIKILPDEIKERLKEKIKAKTEENDTNISLGDDGNYKIETKKESRLFWIFKVKEKINAMMDSETGDTKVNGPWWGFLAKDSQN